MPETPTDPSRTSPPAPPFPDPRPEPDAADERPPSPDTPTLLADNRFLTELQNRGELEPYAGNYVAALNRAVVGSGPNAAALLDEVSAKHRVPKARLAILFVY